MQKKYPEPFRREGTRLYSFFVTENGKRAMKATGCKQKEAARAFVRQYIDGLSTPVKPAAATKTFKEYAAPYFIWEPGKQPSCPHASRLVAEGQTIGRRHVTEAHRLAERALERVPAFGALPMEAIRRADVLDLRAALSVAFKGRISQRMLASIKIILSEAAYRQDLDTSPAAAVGPMKIVTQERGAFTLEELRAILSTCPGRMGLETRLKAFFTFLAATGTRTGEARALRWQSVNLETRETAILEAAKADALETGLPKWDKKRRIILPRLALAALKEWQGQALRTDPEDYIFDNGHGRMLSQTVIKKSWTSIMAASTIKTEGRWLTPHSLRHSLNSILLASGCSTLAVAEYMGWSSEIGKALSKVQAGYTHIELLDLRKVADAIDTALGPEKAGNVRQFA